VKTPKKRIRHRWIYQDDGRAVCAKCGVFGTVIPHPTSAVDPRRVRPDDDAKCVGRKIET